MLNLQGQAKPERFRYQGLKQANCLRTDVLCGEVGRLSVARGAVVSITNVDGGSSAWLTAISDGDSNFGVSALDVPTQSLALLDSAAFDSRWMAAVAAGRGGALADAQAFRVFDEMTVPGDIFVTTVNRDAELVVIAPASKDFLSKGGGGRVSVSVKPPDGRNCNMMLPEPLGKVHDEWRVMRGTARAYELKKGQFVQIIDVEGQQCSDFMAMRSDALDVGLERHIDSTVSRTMSRSAYPAARAVRQIFSIRTLRPLLAVRRDTVGRHDTFALACTARGYEERGFPGHLNCSDNISEAFGAVRHSVASGLACHQLLFQFLD